MPEGEVLNITENLRGKEPESLDTREDVLSAFNSAYTLFEKDASSSSDKVGKARFRELKNIKEKTLDQGRSKYRKSVRGKYDEKFTQIEGLPVEDLIEILTKKIDSPDTPLDFKEKYENDRAILARNSAQYLEIKGSRRGQDQRIIARIWQEYRDRKANPDLTSGDERVDHALAAERIITKRRELVIPKGTKEEKIAEKKGEYEDHRAEYEETAGEYGEYLDIPSVQDIRLDFHIINRTQDVEKRARELAEEKLREKFEGRNVFRKIKYRIGEEYYRQKFTERIRKAMIENNNSYLTMDIGKDSIIGTNHRLKEEREAGRAKVRQVREGLTISGEKVVEAGGEVRRALIEQIIKPVVRGDITQEEQLIQRLTDFVKLNQNDPLVQEIFGRDQSLYGRTAEYFASDILEIAQNSKQLLSDHDFSIEQLDKIVNIKFAATEWGAQTQKDSKLSKTDRFIKWAQKRKTTAVIFSPVTVGTISSIATFMSVRALGASARLSGIAAPGAGMLTGGFFAAMRRNYDLKADRAAHQVEMAYGMRVREGSKRREEIERHAYQTAFVTDLIEGGGEDEVRVKPRRSVKELIRNVWNEEARKDLISRISEIEERLDYSVSRKVDLIVYEGREQVEQGRLMLLKNIAQAKSALKSAGVEESQVELEKEVFRHRFDKDIKDKDRSFKSYRIKSAIAMGASGAVAGLASGIIAREIIQHSGLVGRGRVSVLEQNLKDVSQKGGRVSINEHFQIKVDSADRSVSFLDPTTNKSLTSADLTIKPNGQLTVFGDLSEEIQDQLRDNGLGAEFKGDITTADLVDKEALVPDKTVGHRTLIPEGTKWTKSETDPSKWNLVADNDPKKILVADAEFDRSGRLVEFDKNLSAEFNIEEKGSLSKVVHGEKAASEWRKIATEIDRRKWGQGNELKFHVHKDGDSVILDMNRMGEFQGGKNGFAFSMPGETHKIIWIPEDADGRLDGYLRLDPNDTENFIDLPDGKKISLGDFSKNVLNSRYLSDLPDGDIATEVFPERRNVFRLAKNGRLGFIEAGKLTKEEGQTVLKTFATIRGSSPIQAGIEGEVSISFNLAEELPLKIPSYDIFPVTPSPEIPIIPLPFASRLPLETLDSPERAVNYSDHIDAEYYEEGRNGEYPEQAGYKEPYIEYAENAQSGELHKAELVYPESSPEALDEERIEDQKKYIELLRNKYAVDSDNEDVVRMLYRLNSGSKGYIEELEEVAAALPPMSEKARLTIAIPAYNEEGNIERALRSWTGQIESSTGNKVDPQTIEILIIDNRPNVTKNFDKTKEVVEGLKRDPAFSGFSIHVVQKTFNFPNNRTLTYDKNGNQIGVSDRVMMGLIYKYGADLALLRNLQRQDKVRVANHLIRTGGADNVWRNPKFVDTVLSRFESNPHLEQYVSKDDYPPEIFEKIPLFFAAHRLNRWMNYRLTDGKSHIGNGTYRASVYASVGGFEAKADIREEIDLSRRIRSKIRQKEQERGVEARTIDSTINAYDDPRRVAATIKAGRPITKAYADWTKEEIRKISIEDVLKGDLPKEAQLTPENLQFQAQEILRFYFRQFAKGPLPKGLSPSQRTQRAYRLTKKYLDEALKGLGVTNYEIEYEGEIAEQNLYVRIKDTGKIPDLIHKNTQDHRERVAEPNTDQAVLDKVIEKCMRDYEGKYPKGLFGVNVELTNEEIKSIDTLLEKASAIHKNFTEQSPQWKTFVELVEKRRKEGVVFLRNVVIEDSSLEEVKEQTSQEGITVRVPSPIYNLYKWGSTIDSVNKALRLYQTGVNKGAMVEYFGRDISRLMIFTK